MLADSFALAEREIKLLRQAEHPNLLRYYCNENDKMFIYIALELCHCDLDAFVTQLEVLKLEPPVFWNGLLETARSTAV